MDVLGGVAGLIALAIWAVARARKRALRLDPLRAEARVWGIAYDANVTYDELRGRINEVRRATPDGDPIATAARAMRMQRERRASR